jgi:GTP-binding protein
MESNFVDYVKILCRSGKGGKGSMHLKHVKYNPNGGPDGGDGGRGGNIYLRGNHNYWTLLHLKYERHIFAEHGGNGGRDKCHGTDGKDIYIDVPCGTVVYNAETGKYVCDVTYDGQVIMLLKGGRGGLGNFQFRSATNQAPRYAQPGEPMQEMTVILELKLLADVGLVGFPNAGKSTLVSALSNAKPKIANYPFTTMEPSLGIVGYRDQKSFVMADIPGIIEGASEGRGLGLRFLRHIERNSLLLFMVPGDTDDIRREYEILLNELRQFNPELCDKHRVLAVTKCDLLDEELMEMLREELRTITNPETPSNSPCLGGEHESSLNREDLGGSIPVVFISAVTGFGLEELKDVLWAEMNAESNKLAAITTSEALAHKDKDMTRFQEEMADEGEDEDIEIIDVDEDDIEDLDDFEYEEDE